VPETPELRIETTPVEAPEPDVALDLQAELAPRLDDDAERDLANLVAEDHRAALLDRAEWETRLGDWDNQYFGVLPDKEFPWPGCSNFHVPLTMLGIETLKPRLVQSVIGSEPLVYAKPTESSDEARADKVELFLNWQLPSEIDIAPLVVESAHIYLNPGVVVAKVLWRVDKRRTRVLRRFPLGTTTDEIFRLLFGPHNPESFEKRGEYYEGTIRNPGATSRHVKVKFVVTATEILASVERDEVLYEGPRVELVDPIDIITPANAGSDVQRMPFVQHRQYLYEDELRRRVKSGQLYADRVDELVNVVRGTGESQFDSADIRASRAEAEGVEAEGASNVRDTQFEILEDYRLYDIDDDGWGEEIVVWTSMHLPGKILGYDYLDNICGHGKRPLVIARYMPIPGRFYGLSFPEVVRGIQEEINAIHNQRVDYGTIQNAPRYFYRASSSHNPTAYRVPPGGGIPIENPTSDIFVPNWNGSPAWGQAEEALLYQYFERLTGLTDLALGRQPNRVGATRTASGTNALLSEASLRFETSMRHFQRFWVEIFEHVLALDGQYLPPNKEFRVTGKLPEIVRIEDRMELTGRYDLRLSSTTETLNREVVRSDAQIKLNAALNPIALQLGVIGAKGLLRLYRNFFKAYGEADPDLVVEIPPEGTVRTPEEELALWVSGGDARPHPMENVVLHLDTHVAQRSDPQVQLVLGPPGLAKLDAHIAQTAQLAQTKAIAATMGQRGARGQVGPQAMNAETGAMAPGQATTQDSAEANY